VEENQFYDEQISPISHVDTIESCLMATTSIWPDFCGLLVTSLRGLHCTNILNLMMPNGFVVDLIQIPSSGVLLQP